MMGPNKLKEQMLNKSTAVLLAIKQTELSAEGALTTLETSLGWTFGEERWGRKEREGVQGL